MSLIMQAALAFAPTLIPVVGIVIVSRINTKR